MSPQSILVGQIIIVLCTIVCGVWLSTQWVAAQFSYDAYLGPAWFYIGETPVYYPWRIFEWGSAFDAYAPGVFARGGASAAGSGVESRASPLTLPHEVWYNSSAAVVV